MAINQTDKQLNVVDQLVEQATRLDDVLDEAASLIAQYAQAGTLEDETLEGTALQHVDANDVTLLTYRFNDLLAWINDQFRRDILRKVRK